MFRMLLTHTLRRTPAIVDGAILRSSFLVTLRFLVLLHTFNLGAHNPRVHTFTMHSIRPTYHERNP